MKQENKEEVTFQELLENAIKNAPDKIDLSNNFEHPELNSLVTDHLGHGHKVSEK